MEDDFKPFEYGMSFGAGFEFDALTIDASYDFGMANIFVSGKWINSTE